MSPLALVGQDQNAGYVRPGSLAVGVDRGEALALDDVRQDDVRGISGPVALACELAVHDVIPHIDETGIIPAEVVQRAVGGGGHVLNGLEGRELIPRRGGRAGGLSAGKCGQA